MENLYSKYRPQSFNEIFGHKTIVSAFKKRAKEDFPQAIFIEGLTGTGKTTLANIIAKSILCKNKDANGNSCNVCDNCKTVTHESNTQYFRMYNASNIGIDDMRELEDFVNQTTLSLVDEKVIIIDEMQELDSNKKAQKNILKILEKVQKDTYFILLAMNGYKVDSAIKNRCVPYKLKPLDFEDIAGYLESICNKENVKLDTEEKSNVIITIADNSYGSMRTACSYLERVLDSGLWTVKDMISELNIISNNDLIKVINNILKGDADCFSIKLEKEIIDRIRYIACLVYKAKNKVSLSAYEKGQLNGIDSNCDIKSVVNLIEGLNEFIKFPYLTQELIDFTIINILNKNKVDEQPARRRLAE